MAMEILTIINAVANLVVTFTVILFMIFVFGYSEKIDTLHFTEKFFIKAGLATVACGSLLNFLTLTTPPPSEIVMNCGLAILFTWGVWFHYKHYKK